MRQRQDAKHKHESRVERIEECRRHNISHRIASPFLRAATLNHVGDGSSLDDSVPLKPKREEKESERERDPALADTGKQHGSLSRSLTLSSLGLRAVAPARAKWWCRRRQKSGLDSNPFRNWFPTLPELVPDPSGTGSRPFGNWFPTLPELVPPLPSLNPGPGFVYGQSRYGRGACTVRRNARRARAGTDAPHLTRWSYWTSAP